MGDSTLSQGTAQNKSESLEITPNIIGMVVGEPRMLRLCDERGQQIRDADWASSDPTLAKIEAGPDATIIGLAPGKLTVTATWQSRRAEAQVTVFAGPELPQGTIRWSIQPTPGYSAKQIVQAAPVEGAPDLYAVEEDRCGRVITRALTSDGRQMWRTSVRGTGRGAARVEGKAKSSTATSSPREQAEQQVPRTEPPSAADAGCADAPPESKATPPAAP